MHAVEHMSHSLQSYISDYFWALATEKMRTQELPAQLQALHEALTAERTAPEAHVTGRLVPAQLFFDDPAADAVEGEPGLVLMMTPLQGLPAGGAERRKTPR